MHPMKRRSVIIAVTATLVLASLGAIPVLAQDEDNEVPNTPFAALAVEKSVRVGDGAYANNTTAEPGDEVDYHLNITNEGNATATNVTITDSLPPRTTFVSCTVNCSEDNGTVEWDVGIVSAGASVEVTLTVVLDDAFPNGETTIANTATASSDDGDVDSNEATVTVTAAVGSTLDKAVRNGSDDGEFADSASAAPGDDVEYRIAYTNAGNAAATNVTVTDAVPDHSTFVSCSDDCAEENGTITWALGDVGAGDGANVTFVVALDDEFPTGTTSIENTANASSDQDGPVDSDEVTVEVTSAPASVLDKAVRNVDAGEAFGDASAADPGDEVEYRITYTNNGNSTADNVTIADAAPERTTFVSCSSDCLEENGTITWDVGSVAPGGSAEVTFVAALDDEFPDGTTQIDNTASVESNATEQTDSDTVTVTVTVEPPAPDSSLDKDVRNVDAVGSYADSIEADPGDEIQYRLSYTNTGEANATNVIVRDGVPQNATFVSCSGTCNFSGDGGPGSTLTWEIGTVAPNETVEVSFVVELDEEFPNGTTEIENIATVTTDEEGRTSSDAVIVAVTVEREAPDDDDDDDDGDADDGDDDGDGDDGETKTICHHPPGNPGNAHTITVGENAWKAHERHGDTEGECGDDHADHGHEDGHAGKGNGKGKGRGHGPPGDRGRGDDGGEDDEAGSEE